MNNSCIVVLTFCRKCHKLRNCLETNNVSDDYKFLCKQCAREEVKTETCIGCGREGIRSELEEHGWFCHICESDNIVECELCGKEVYTSSTIFEGICKDCAFENNIPCNKCGTYYPKDKLSSGGLCEKCSIKIYKKLRESNINEVIECVQCGREELVNNINDNGICIYCKCEGLENEIKKLNKKKKVYS